MSQSKELIPHAHQSLARDKKGGEESPATGAWETRRWGATKAPQKRKREKESTCAHMSFSIYLN